MVCDLVAAAQQAAGECPDQDAHAPLAEPDADQASQEGGGRVGLYGEVGDRVAAVLIKQAGDWPPSTTLPPPHPDQALLLLTSSPPPPPPSLPPPSPPPASPTFPYLASSSSARSGSSSHHKSNILSLGGCNSNLFSFSTKN